MNPSDYDAVYHYAPAPLMPGIRKLHGKQDLISMTNPLN